MASSLSFPAISITSKLLLMLYLIFVFFSPLARPSSIGIHSISKLLQLHDRERAPPNVQVAAARRALLRLLPSHSSSFDFQIASKDWVDLYSERRYGRSIPSIQDAWRILYQTIYNCTDGAYDKNRDVIVAFPDVEPSSIPTSYKTYHQYDKQVSRRAKLREVTETFEPPHLWYSTSEVIHALELFLASGDELSGSNTYMYDLVDLTRQALAKHANQLFVRVIESYLAKDTSGVTFHSQTFLDLVQDMDTLLACQDGFLLGTWLESAKQLAKDEKQEKQFEWNARTQITMWFDNTKEEASLLRDYGNKYWSGLLRDYYGPRAAIYFKYLLKSLKEGNGFQLKDWRKEWIKLTNDWQGSRNVFPVEHVGNALNISHCLYHKYLRSS